MTHSIHEFTLRIYYEDTDAGGIVYYANYLRYLERARTEALRSWGADVAALVRQGAWFVVSEVAMKLHAPARYDDVLVVSTRLVELRRASFRLAHEIRRDGTLLVTNTTLMACVNPSLRPGRIPEETMAALRRFEAPLP
jgi:tol-pal system-associated acyl-CoA thioesterase